MSVGRRIRPRPADFRPWREGDPTACAYATRSARLMPPCGPPVLVRDVELLGARRTSGARDEPLCLLHAAARFVEAGLATLCLDAEQRAREVVCGAHLDEYATAREVEAAAVVEQVLDALPTQLWALVPERPDVLAAIPTWPPSEPEYGVRR